MKRHSQRLRDILRRGLAIAVTVPMMVSFAPVAFAEDGAGTGNGSATPSASSGLNLLASYDFSDGTATDTSGNGYNLTMNGGAKVEAFGDRNNNQALSLRGNGQYASFPDELFAKAGNSFTMEFAAKSRHADDGNYFSFSVGGSQQKYLFWYLSTKSTKFVISDNKWNNEQGFKTSLSNNDNIWHNYKLIVDGETLTMLRDGELVGYKANTGITMADLGSTAATIGKSLYSGDAYWSGAIDDIKIYQGADVTLPSSVTIVGDGVLDGALTMVENSATKLTATVSPENAISTDVTWESSKTSVATVGSDGTVTAVTCRARMDGERVGLDAELAGTLTSCSLIVLSAVLTTLGWYQKLAAKAGAGSLVPITGFANAVVSAAIEFKAEGRVTGTGAKMFLIAGPVIVYGTLAAVVYGGVLWLLGG